MKQVWRGVGVALLVIAIATVAGAGEFAALGNARALKGAPGVYEWRYEAAVGPSPFDRIGVHRVARRPKPPENPAAVVLYLPGTNMNGEAAVEDPKYNLITYLASKDIDAWSMDYRTHFIPPGTPEDQLAELKTWNDELFESDIDRAGDFVMRSTRHAKLFVAGFSRGVAFAYLYAARHPERVAGIIALDGFIGSKPMMAGMPGRYADDIGGRHLTYEKRKHLMAMVIANPDGPAPIPKYKSARENLEHVVYDSPGFGGKGGLANPQGGFSDPVILARVLIRYDRWWPTVQNYERALTPELRETLAKSKIPVIAFSSTNIAPRWPPMVRESASSTGGNVTFKELSGFGHLDVLCGTKSEAEVYAPIASWVTRHAR